MRVRTEMMMVLYLLFYGCNIFLPMQFNSLFSTKTKVKLDGSG